MEIIVFVAMGAALMSFWIFHWIENVERHRLSQLRQSWKTLEVSLDIPDQTDPNISL